MRMNFKSGLILFLCIFVLVVESSANSILPYLGDKSAINGLKCDICIKFMQGVVYDIGILKSKALESIERNCSKWFSKKYERYEKCVRVLSEQIVILAQDMEDALNPNSVCVRAHFCKMNASNNRTKHTAQSLSSNNL
ncbi:unnamed protein product [Anisakis simplex]|uniref:Saposin B-type domain-containing protein n=1 Tax=Anisakis simplex TaxID=6269 RepID=A0A0M3JXG5_ANISI|nr:unnamed protein product [Anisakis simplex]